MKKLLDVTDRRLLTLLQNDARRSITSLGKELNLSRTAVQARLARLERDRVITGYAAILHEPLDAVLSAILSLRFTLRPCSLVIDRIRSWPEIVHGYSTAGPTDAVLVVRVASTAALSELVDRFKAVSGVDAVETIVVLDSFAGRSTSLQ